MITSPRTTRSTYSSEQIKAAVSLARAQRWTLALSGRNSHLQVESPPSTREMDTAATTGQDLISGELGGMNSRLEVERPLRLIKIRGRLSCFQYGQLAPPTRLDRAFVSPAASGRRSDMDAPSVSWRFFVEHLRRGYRPTVGQPRRLRRLQSASLAGQTAESCVVSACDWRSVNAACVASIIKIAAADDPSSGFSGAEGAWPNAWPGGWIEGGDPESSQEGSSLHAEGSKPSTFARINSMSPWTSCH